MRTRRRLVWAVVGALVLLAGIVTAIVVAITAGGAGNPQPEASTAATPAQTSSAMPVAPQDGDVVDASVAQRGLVPEPITSDVEEYAIAALEAAGTFDTTKVSREELVDHLATWFTPDPRPASAEDLEYAFRSVINGISENTVLPVYEWDSLADERGTSTAVVDGNLSIIDTGIYYTGEGTMQTVFADVVVTYTRLGGDGVEASYDERVRVGVAVLCGADAVPAPGSAQTPADCKALSYASAANEE